MTIAALAERLATTGDQTGLRAECLVLLKPGYRLSTDGQSHTPADHILHITLYPNSAQGPCPDRGAVRCSCTTWADYGHQDGATPRLLPYRDLVVWIAGHAERVGAPEAAVEMRAALTNIDQASRQI